MFLTANSTFWPSSRTLRTTKSTIEVAFRSSRTRTTVPSRINRQIGSSASERAFQTSQSLFTLRHTRLTVSLPIAPPNRLTTPGALEPYCSCATWRSLSGQRVKVRLIDPQVSPSQN
jgi:hypothetical protein